MQQQLPSRCDGWPVCSHIELHNRRIGLSVLNFDSVSIVMFLATLLQPGAFGLPQVQGLHVYCLGCLIRHQAFDNAVRSMTLASLHSSAQLWQ